MSLPPVGVTSFPAITDLPLSAPLVITSFAPVEPQFSTVESLSPVVPTQSPGGGGGGGDSSEMNLLNSGSLYRKFYHILSSMMYLIP